MPKPALRRLSLITAAVLAAPLSATAPALAAGPTGSASCPAAYPVADLQRDMPVSGLTVSRGTTPEPFTGSVLGVIADGIAPGLDMVVAELDSPELRRVGGIWAGMSGSPVYASDGRLIGAVAYGLSFGPSRVAGITPAQDMYRVLDYAAGSPGARAAGGGATMSSAMASKAVADGAASESEARSELRQLPLPLGLSGLSATRRANSALMSRLPLSGTRVYAAAPATGAGGPSEQLVAGGNLGAGLAYGDVSAVAVGTVTAVCGTTTLGFGHPFSFSGASHESLHGADALYVQDDPTLTPFKVANPSRVVGTIDQDRLAGNRGQVGALPSTTPVTTHVSADGRSRDGRTDTVDPRVLPAITAFGLLANIDRVFDQIGGGVAAIDYTVRGTRADGSPWELTRSDRLADPSDIGFAGIFPVAGVVDTLQNQPFEDVDITSVDVSDALTSQYADYSVTKLEVLQAGGGYAVPSTDQPLVVAAGSVLRLRATLTPYRHRSPDVVVPISLRVPLTAAGASGQLNLSGGGSGLPGGGDGGGDGESSEPQTFDDLLAQLRSQPRGDTLVASLQLFPGGGDGAEPMPGPAPTTSYPDKPEPGPGGGATPPITVSQSRQLDRVVLGGRSFAVTVLPAAGALPASVLGRAWYQRSSLTSGGSDAGFMFGGTGIPVAGDWDGDGHTSPGTFTDGQWRRVGAPAVAFGQAGDRPVVGDWDGDGVTDLGVRRGAEFLLRSADGAVTTVTLGLPGDRPVAGDFDGDGVATVGVVHEGEWTLLSANSSAAGIRSFRYGLPGDSPVVGDWDGDGRDGVGVVRRVPGTLVAAWMLRNGASGGRAGIVFRFGPAAGTQLTWR